MQHLKSLGEEWPLVCHIPIFSDNKIMLNFKELCYKNHVT